MRELHYVCRDYDRAWFVSDVNSWGF